MMMLSGNNRNLRRPGYSILTPDDEALTTRFEQMYDHPDLHVPWYIT